MLTDELPAEDIDTSFVPRRRDRIATAELDGEAVLYNEETGRIHTLDRIATIVWACFDGTASVHAIARELAGAFETDWVVVEADVLSLVRRLGTEGLIAGIVAEPDAVDDEPAADGRETTDGTGHPDAGAVGYEGDTRGCA